MAANWYAEGIKLMMENVLGITAVPSGTVKIALLNNHSVDLEADQYFDDISADEVSGTGYTQGGAALSSLAVTIDTSGDLVYFDADDASWSTATLTADAFVIYVDTGTDSTSPLLCYIDASAELSTVATDFVVPFLSTGIAQIDYTP